MPCQLYCAYNNAWRSSLNTGTQDSFGVALVGVGMVSSTYASALESLSGQIHLQGVMANRPESAQSFIDRHGSLFSAATLYKSISEITSDPAVDAVLLTTPPNARKELIQHLATSEIPVLVEKPLERDLSAAIELCEMCERTATPFGIVLQHRVRPSAIQLVELLNRHDVGELCAVEINVPWWREQAYYDEPGRGTYERDGGGVLINQAIHTLDLALQFTPALKEVTAFSATTGLHRMEAEDFVTAGLSFENGVVGSLFASTACYPGSTESVELHFKRASIRLEASLLQIRWHDGREETFGGKSGSGSGADPMAFTADWHASVISGFCNAVKRNEAPPLPARSALAVHAFISAIEDSAKSGATVTVTSV